MGHNIFHRAARTFIFLIGVYSLPGIAQTRTPIPVPSGKCDIELVTDKNYKKFVGQWIEIQPPECAYQNLPPKKIVVLIFLQNGSFATGVFSDGVKPKLDFGYTTQQATHWMIPLPPSSRRY